MAKAKVSDLFHAYCQIEQRMKTVAERDPRDFDVHSYLVYLLNSCDLEVEIPLEQEAEYMIGGLVEIKTESEENRCSDCRKPAVWVRHTQFSGDHFFCDECARKQRNFGSEGDNSFWEGIAVNKTDSTATEA